MHPQKLIDIIERLASYDQDFKIYALRPWTSESAAIVAPEPHPGALPPDAEAFGGKYFLEVWLAAELVEDWTADRGKPMSVTDQCERLIHYATHDA